MVGRKVSVYCTWLSKGFRIGGAAAIGVYVLLMVPSLKWHSDPILCICTLRIGILNMSPN